MDVHPQRGPIVTLSSHASLYKRTVKRGWRTMTCTQTTRCSYILMFNPFRWMSLFKISSHLLQKELGNFLVLFTCVTTHWESVVKIIMHTRRASMPYLSAPRNLAVSEDLSCSVFTASYKEQNFSWSRAQRHNETLLQRDHEGSFSFLMGSWRLCQFSA